MPSLVHRFSTPARIAAVVLCVTAAVGVSAASASATTAAATASPAQPALTADDHPITDVPGLVNGRELGTFAGIGGQLVDTPRLIRSESLDKISAAGAQTLASEYKVDLVIDLRTPGQVAAKPDVPIPGAKSVNISMFGADGNYSDDTAMYHDLVDKGYVDAATPGPMISAYSQVLQLLATHTGGTVLIHCSHGMDRTGTVIDLLDHILGVNESDILHDYLLSNTQLGVTWATPDLLQGTFETDVANKYAGMDSYLSKTIGVTAQETADLRARFLVSNDANASSISVGGVAVPLDAAATAAGASITRASATLAAADVQVSTDNAGATSAVTVSGQNVTVTVTAPDGATTKQYRIAVAKPAITIAQGDTLTSGSTVTISGSGFTPGAAYQIVVHSDPIVIGQATAAADGTVSASAVVPSSLPAGAHTVFLADAAGNAVSASLNITLASAPAASANLAATSLAGPSVATGGTRVAPTPTWPMAGLGLLGVGLLTATAVAYRRTRRTTGR
ncbi:tyrosine-protein phosphatase [Agreia sp. COWG]|uniref:tyrosine-protein phosphatase n=1 Tax=Agreia sp. COWG TaxID=2773266 RepID=UPI001AF61A24|nr:tyrosine-protein phosphatase [Agreia sp. COWG]CAD6005797.1 Protein tyrosine/serine phosphatase [Agreia sp. COWG]